MTSFGFPGISVGFLSHPSSKFNFKNPPKIWKNEIEKTIQQLSIFQELKYYDLKDANLARYLFDQSKILKWRQQRSYLISTNLQILEDEREEEEEEDEEKHSEYCKIILRTVINGAPLNINSLVHITGVGAARIHKVTKINAKNHASSRSHSKATGEDGVMDEDDINADLDEVCIEADPTL